jgi:hypothetical protein
MALSSIVAMTASGANCEELCELCFPLYPQNRTSLDPAGTSQPGQERKRLPHSEAVDAEPRLNCGSLCLLRSKRITNACESGIAIEPTPARSVIAVLQSGAAAVRRAWWIRSGPVCRQILDAFDAANRGSATARLNRLSRGITWCLALFPVAFRLGTPIRELRRCVGRRVASR